MHLIKLSSLYHTHKDCNDQVSPAIWFLACNFSFWHLVRKMKNYGGLFFIKTCLVLFSTLVCALFPSSLLIDAAAVFSRPKLTFVCRTETHE